MQVNVKLMASLRNKLPPTQGGTALLDVAPGTTLAALVTQCDHEVMAPEAMPWSILASVTRFQSFAFNGNGRVPRRFSGSVTALSTSSSVQSLWVSVTQ